jgi:hypothetical protein
MPRNFGPCEGNRYILETNVPLINLPTLIYLIMGIFFQLTYKFIYFHKLAFTFQKRDHNYTRVYPKVSELSR